MLDSLIDKLGNSNPQIFRELKERLTLRNIAIAVIGSLVLQGLVLLYFNAQIPVPMPSLDRDLVPSHDFPAKIYHKYCYLGAEAYNNSELCQLDDTGNFRINWQHWRSDLFICLSWLLPLGLILGAVYALVADLIQEEKRGTLNFIRLSPQSARQIFVGKIVGVPILVYIAAGLMLPLHLAIGLSAKATLPLLISWYVAIGSLWLLLSCLSALYVLLGGIQAIVTTIIVAFPLSFTIAILNSFLTGTINRENWLANMEQPLYWFGLLINSKATLFYGFETGSCIIACYWIWQALERRYLNPTATVMSKYQSYPTNLCFQTWIAGFIIPLIFITSTKYYATNQMLCTLAVVDFIALLCLIPMLLPTKQALQDWSRYRRERTHLGRKFWQRELVRDLISNDKSPALLAIAINVGIAIVPWTLVSIFTHTTTAGMRGSIHHTLQLLAGICIAASLILIYAAIAHLGLFLNVKKQKLWIGALVGGMMFLPLIIAYVLSPVQSPTGLAATILLFSPFASLGMFQLSGVSLLVTVALELAMFVTLTERLRRKLQFSGRSATQELLAHS